MATRGRKNKAHINKQLWDRANNTDRSKWRSKSQKGYDFYLDEQILHKYTLIYLIIVGIYLMEIQYMVK